MHGVFELSSRSVAESIRLESQIFDHGCCQLEANIRYSSLLVTRPTQVERAKPTRVERALEVTLE